MRFSLNSPWPCGAGLILAGTVITVEDGVARWSGGKLPLPMPLNARAGSRSCRSPLDRLSLQLARTSLRRRRQN